MTEHGKMVRCLVCAQGPKGGPLRRVGRECECCGEHLYAHEDCFEKLDGSEASESRRQPENFVGIWQTGT